MTNQNNYSWADFLNVAQQTSQTILKAMDDASIKTGEALGTTLYEFVEQGTETIGNTVAPIANHPFTKFATKVPGLSWLMAAFGQVDVEAVQKEVESLRHTYPLEGSEVLAQRVIADTAWNAAGVGLATNFVPPVALMLLAVDLGAVVALQARMIYKVAAIYGFSPTDPARLGEVMAIWGLSSGSSSVLKAGMSVVELLPFAGTTVGSVGNAAIVYGLGQVACRFYEAKQRAEVKDVYLARQRIEVREIEVNEVSDRPPIT